MNILYFKPLQEYNYHLHPVTLEKEYNRGYTMDEIKALELEFNNGTPFPKALQELLYLAGKKCNVHQIYHDYPSDPLDDLDPWWGMAELTREIKNVGQNIYGINPADMFAKPFFALSCPNGEDGGQFVYLDEGDDPPFRVWQFGDGTFEEEGDRGKLVDATLHFLHNLKNTHIEWSKLGPEK
jgi:hypothetical protein